MQTAPELLSKQRQHWRRLGVQARVAARKTLQNLALLKNVPVEEERLFEVIEGTLRWLAPSEACGWRSDDFRLRLAARDLLKAARALIEPWETGDLAAAVRDLGAVITDARLRQQP